MSDYLNNFSEAVLSDISEKLHDFRDEAERQMDEAIRDYEILDEVVDALEMEIERREACINSIVALCLTGK